MRFQKTTNKIFLYLLVPFVMKKKKKKSESRSYEDAVPFFWVTLNKLL